MNWLKRAFGCKWERLKNPPNWIDSRARAMCPETIKEYKGRTFIYKIIRGTPINQGDMPVTYYRRLRYKAFK